MRKPGQRRGKVIVLTLSCLLALGGCGQQIPDTPTPEKENISPSTPDASRTSPAQERPAATTPTGLSEIPDPPTVTARRAGNGNVELAWSSPAESGGVPIIEVEVTINGQSIGSQGIIGMRQEGTGPNQTFTITARAKNNESSWSANSEQATAATSGDGTWRAAIGGTNECNSEIKRQYAASEGSPDPEPLPECKDTVVELTDWYPHTTVLCTASGKQYISQEYLIDARGTGGGVFSEGAYVPSTGTHLYEIESCNYV